MAGRLAVIGSGLMGSGIAQVSAQAGWHVTMRDIDDESLQRGLGAIRDSLGRFAAKGKITEEDAEATLGRISATTDLDAVADADVVVEAIFERIEAKHEVFRALDKICKSGAILGTNTSAIPITRIAALTRRPAQVVGIHFMNPVPLKDTVEVVRGYHTSDETLAATTALLARMGKQWIVVKDSPGFVSNRVLMLTINEAIFLAQEQVAPVEEIDRIFTTCFGHKMGPLATADLIGLDTILYSIEVLHDSFGDSKYRPCPLLRKYVAAGWLGKKAGRGFFAYDA